MQYKNIAKGLDIGLKIGWPIKARYSINFKYDARYYVFNFVDTLDC